MALKVLVALFLVQILAVQAEAETVFVKRGEDLHLAGPGTVTLTKERDFLWKHNRTNNILRLSLQSKAVIFSKYEGRAVISDKNHSLLLKNVSYIDSGNYAAVLSESTDRSVGEYRVQVLDPVSPVELRVGSVSSKGHSCNISLTCGTTQSHINSSIRCVGHTCSQDGEEESVQSSPHIYLVATSIVCNHSNQVSWSADQKESQDFCSQIGGEVFEAAPIRWTVVLLWLQLLFVFVGVFLVAGVSCRGRRLKTAAGLSPDSIPDQTQPPPAEETVYELDD
ncbi:uncharacterized protein ACB058_015623 isoform 1-T2 [Synchiropus picturatus]